MAIFSFSRSYRDKAPLLAALFVSSIMSGVILAGRVAYSGQWTFIFLSWNLFLAWIPLCSALALWHLNQRKRSSNLPYFALFICWLIFFPNSPYLVTDLMHLAKRQNVPLWYDTMLLFSYAWNGLILAFVSLWIVQEFMQARFGKVASWLVVSFSLAASGFGIYLGRFLRWNSWDLLADPHGLAIDILDRVANPLAHPQTIAVTLLFSGFLTVAYITITLLARVHWAQIDPGESISR
jgi:uncharacterized membrane protein